MLKILNAFIKEHRTELGLKGYSKMSYLEKLKYIEGKVKGTKYEREIGKLTKPRVDEGIKKVLEKSGRGQNVKVKTDKVKVRREKFEKAVKDLRKRVPPQEKQKSDPTPEMPKPCSLVNTLKPPKPESVKYLKDNDSVKTLTRASAGRGFNSLTDGKYLYVIDGKSPKTIKYVDAKLEKEKDVKHTSIAEAIGATEVLMAGEIFKKGDTFKINNSSGHYKPDAKCNDYLVWLMKHHYGLTLDKQSKRELKERVREDFIYKLRPERKQTSATPQTNTSKPTPLPRDEPKKDSLDKLSIKQLIKGIDKFYAPTKVKHPKEPKKEKLLAFIKKKNIPRSDFDDKADEIMDKDLFLQVSQVMSDKAKRDKLEKFKDFTIEDLRSGMRKYGREKNIRQKGINNASREGIEKFILSKNIPLSYFKKGGVNRVDIDDILNEAVKFTKDFEKENKSKIIKAILKARAEKRQDSGIELQIDRLFSTRGNIKKAIRIYVNSLSNFTMAYLRLQQERFDA